MTTTTTTRQTKETKILVNANNLLAPRYAVGFTSKYNPSTPTPVAYFANFTDAWNYSDQENAKAAASGLAYTCEVTYTCWDILG